MQAIRLDVTKQEDIDAAVATITKAGRGLYGLVNNAGVATPGPMANISMQEFDLQMQVNVYGPVRMSKAFLPLLLESKGRITNIGSISGVLARKDLNTYAMTKHAIEAFTDSLAARARAAGRDRERGRAWQLQLRNRRQRHQAHWAADPHDGSQQVQGAG